MFLFKKFAFVKTTKVKCSNNELILPKAEGRQGLPGIQELSFCGTKNVFDSKFRYCSIFIFPSLSRYIIIDHQLKQFLNLNISW